MSIQFLDILKRIQLEKRRDDLFAGLHSLANPMRSSLVQAGVKRVARVACVGPARST